MNGVEHMRLLADGDDPRWSQGYPLGGAPDVEPPYYSNTLARAWSVMMLLIGGAVGFALGGIAVGVWALS